MKKKIVVLTGAGISAESGLSTFRDSGGLWDGHDVMEVASPEGWRRNKELVLEFYNQRRRQLKNVKPNDAHLALKKLEDKFEVMIITQNVDNLHERAGSSNIIHLHGELTKARSTSDHNLVYDIGDDDITSECKCEKGSQLRPHIVWFGEPVPKMEQAVAETMTADIFLVIGTSLVVYPAAGLLEYVDHEIPKYLIDPKIPEGFFQYPNLTMIPKKAGEGTKELAEILLNKA